MEKKWKYKISDGYLGTILSFVMLAAFGGLTYWLYATKNGAFLVAMILTTIMFLAFIAAFYRASFHKVLVGKEGFYYQSGIGDGKYYRYTLLKNAWTSAGQTLNGYHSHYCNFETAEGKVIRFSYFPASKAAVNYLLKRYKAAGGIQTDITKDTHEYQITGRGYGKTSLVIGVILLAVLAVLNMIAMKFEETKFAFVPWILVVIFALVYLIVQYFCFQVQIGIAGFYCRTTPFNGQYYLYSEIAECQEIKKAYRHGVGADSPIYYFYFVFTDRTGKTRRFQFEKPIYEHEIHVLRERIEDAQVRDLAMGHPSKHGRNKFFH